jgi:hypothetical protein
MVREEFPGSRQIFVADVNCLGRSDCGGGLHSSFFGRGLVHAQVFTHYLFSMAVLATYGFYLFDSHQQDAALSPQATNDHP